MEKGHNVLITGAGGGVALIALQLCLARGANVYVTSGSEEKIARAIGLGAKGGVNYKNGRPTPSAAACPLTIRTRVRFSLLAERAGKAAAARWAEQLERRHRLGRRRHRAPDW